MGTFWRLLVTVFTCIGRTLNCIRLLILNILFFTLMLVAIVVWLQFNDDDSNNAPSPHSALLLDISGTVVDTTAGEDKLGILSRRILTHADRLQENSLFDIVNAIRQAKDDPNISGIVLALENFTGGSPSSLHYIGKALREFRDKNKPVYAVSDSYSQEQYYLASFANKIWLSPQGSVDLRGFASNGLYYKSLLEQLKVTTHIFRVGTYKSAVEPFMRDDMSPEAREANSRWIAALWQNYLTTVAANRHISVTQLFPGAAGMVDGLKKAGGNMAKYALDNKLVDELATMPQVETALSKSFGWNERDNNINAVSFYDYPLKPQPEQGAAIAVVFANGTIINGDSAPGYVGSRSLARQIRAARLDPDIKGIVLRVDSPGGSMSAAEAICEELAAVRKAGKPIVVSMGGLAASGGYFISMPANYIVASDSTLTGSIGIYGIINTFENSLQAIGVHSDGVSTSPLASLNVTAPLTPELQQMMQLTVDNGYQRFISVVAKARHKTLQQVDAVGQGHVWVGSDAYHNGLVDQLGDFDDAVAKMAQLLNVKQWHLSFYQQPTGLLDKFVNMLDNSVQAILPATLRSYLPAPFANAAMQLKAESDKVGMLNDPQHRYVFCLNCGDVK